MNTIHNPDRFMADLRQILSQGRKRIGLLVGAGAPLSILLDPDGKLSAKGKPLIPGVDALTTAALEGLDKSADAAVAALKRHLGASANIETILTRVRLLQTALGEDGTIEGLNGPGYKALGEAICANIGKIVGVELPKERNPYNEIVAWVSGTQRQHAVEIFTSNYDLLFEEAFEKVRAAYFDGFTGGATPFFDPVSVAGNDLPARWSRLWKIHGSLGWQVKGDAVVRAGGKTATHLVYPDHLKYDLTQKQPYSALFERLKGFLRDPDTLLLAAGFSFRDAHICAVLDEALSMNANTAVFAFQFNNLDKEEPACKLADDHPNFSVYAADGAVISGIRGAWRPGELPKNWAEIRASFWGRRSEGGSPEFLLGDFAHFSRFCSLAQANDLAPPAAAVVPSPEAAEEGPSGA